MVVHTAPKSKKEATERLTVLMRGCARPQSGPASNRQDTRHSRLQTMLDAEQPDKLLAHLSRCTDHRHNPHPLHVIRHRISSCPCPHHSTYGATRKSGQPIWRSVS